MSGGEGVAKTVKCHERGRGRLWGALTENHGSFLFFLLFPKVLRLPSVTLAKNCEHESRGVRHTWYRTPCMERGCGCVHPLGESSRASRRSRVA